MRFRQQLREYMETEDKLSILENIEAVVNNI